MNKKIWILGILLLCILLLFSTYKRNEGFDGGCPENETNNPPWGCSCQQPYESVNGKCVCASTSILDAHNNCMLPVCPPGKTDNCTPPVQVKNTHIRENNTCPDPRQSYIYDRFDNAVISDMTQAANWGTGVNSNTPMPCTYESRLKGGSIASDKYEVVQYYGFSNLCLSICPKNFIVSPDDNTLCITNDGNCHNTPDLSSNILDSWNQVCGPFTKTELNLTSTINSISSVSATLDNQFLIIDSNVSRLYNSMFETYDSSSDANSSTTIPIRDARYPVILSNYNALCNIYTSTNQQYSYIKAAKDTFDTMYYSFFCNRYQG